MIRPILYHYPDSFSSQIVRLALSEKGVSWRSRRVDIVRRFENYRPWYMHLNLQGVVPTLQHRTIEITECVTIALYINNNFPGPHLVPEGERDRVLMEQWVNLQQKFPEYNLALARLSGFSETIARRDLAKRLKTLREAQDKYDELEVAYSVKYDAMADLEHRVIGNTALAEQLVQQIETMLELIEANLNHSAWLAGDTYSLADIVWTVLLARLELLGLDTLWHDGRHPNLVAYYEKVCKRRSFRKAGIKRRLSWRFKADTLFGALPGLRPFVITVGIILAGLVGAQLVKIFLTT